MMNQQLQKTKKEIKKKKAKVYYKIQEQIIYYTGHQEKTTRKAQNLNHLISRKEILQN